MRIALFHNLGTGGGKRHLCEQAKELSARGHELHLYALRSATSGDSGGEYLPLADLCGETHLYGDGIGTIRDDAGTKRTSSRRKMIEVAKALPLARELLDTLWVRRTERAMADLGHLYAVIARDIDNGSFDVAYIHHCVLTLAPDLLRFIQKTPTVFCCNDMQRSAMEWPVETDSGYDGSRETWRLKRRRGRLLGIAQRRLVQGLEDRFVTNTRAATMVLANSWYSREALASGTGVNAGVCWPGVDTEYFCPAPETDVPRENTVLSVGALLPTKRHEFVLESVALLPYAIRPKFEIIGYAGGPQSAAIEMRLTERARETGVNLTIRKQIQDSELRDAYRRASIVAFAPYLEPFGLAAVEAMACGTPVVGVHEGGVRETVTHGETGFLTGLDSHEFADSLTTLLTKPDLRARLGQQARRDAETRWTWRRSTDTLEPLLATAASTRFRNPR